MHGVKPIRCLPETSWLPSSSGGPAVGVCLPLGGRPSEAEVSNLATPVGEFNAIRLLASVSLLLGSATRPLFVQSKARGTSETAGAQCC